MATGVALAYIGWTSSPTSQWVFAVIASVMVLSRAWLTPVIESLMIIQIKKDPDYGADDLETFGLVMEAFGTVFYCVLGGFMIMWNEEFPSVFYWLIAGTGAVMFLAGLAYPSSSDEIDQHFAAMTNRQRAGLKTKLFWEAVNLPEVRNLLIYIFIVSICAPNLEEFLIYYNESMKVTALFEGYAEVVLFMSGSLIFLIYNSYVMFKAEIHPSAFFATIMRCIVGLFFAYDVAGRYPAGKTLMIQAVATRSFVDAFLYYPAIIYYEKMVPHHIEGMMIGFILSMIKFNWDVVGRLFAVGLNLKFMVMGEPRDPTTGAIIHPEPGAHEAPPFENLYKMYLIQAGCVLFPLFFIGMLTYRNKVEEVQMALHHREHHSKENPHSDRISLAKALRALRETKSQRLTVHNDFPQFSSAVRQS